MYSELSERICKICDIPRVLTGYECHRGYTSYKICPLPQECSECQNQEKLLPCYAYVDFEVPETWVALFELPLLELGYNTLSEYLYDMDPCNFHYNRKTFLEGLLRYLNNGETSKVALIKSKIKERWCNYV